ncbi:hypothetical protein [Streptomyces parvulus]|uniref:hypothetical protein n=1 Tax=Streptomyces parvulus TaxID=146923 RepID=UPI0036F92034
MSTMSTHLPEGELTIEHEGEYVTSSLPQPDPRWKTTDQQGHEHAYAAGPDRYPTLVLVTGDPYWCEDCRDEHADDWYECRLCGERITPGSRVDTTPKWIQGPTRYTLDGEPITAAQAQEIMTRAWHAADEAARIRERPAPGTQVFLDGETVTIAPTDDDVPADQVTIMRHGTGVFVPVPLDALRSKRRPGLG